MTDHCNGCELTLSQFANISSDRDILVEFFIAHDCLKSVIKCPTCSSLKELNYETLSFRCNSTYGVEQRSKKKKKKLRCGFYLSGRRGTFFEDSRITIETIAQFSMFWLLIPNPRQKFIGKQLGVSGSTIVDWSSFCRSVCIKWATESSEQLGGNENIVEIKEVKFNKKYRREPLFKKCKWVYGGIEKETSRCFLVPVMRRDSQTFLTVIQYWIKPCTILISDCWKEYSCLSEEEWICQTKTLSKNFVDPSQSTVEPMEHTIGDIPRFRRKESHSIGYLAEFMFKSKFKNTKNRIHAFWNAVSHLYPLTKIEP